MNKQSSTPNSQPIPGAVLLVEDDTDLAEMYSMQLEDSGFAVFLSATAQDALDKLDTRTIDVIVLDLLLPGQNGLSVLHELRSYEDWRKIPVIILSNLSRRELGVSQKALEHLGVVEFLEKPKTKKPDLTSAAQRAMASHR